MRARRGRAGPLLAVGALLGMALVARRSLDVVEVRGGSMAPTLRPGDRLLVARVGVPRIGEVVLAADPRDSRRELIKRVAAIGPGGVELRGDGRASTDGRTFGRVAVDAIRWRAIARYWPPGRVTTDLRLSRA